MKLPALQTLPSEVVHIGDRMQALQGTGDLDNPMRD